MAVDVELEVETKIDLAVPTLWDVILYDDDATSMEFVVLILMQLFRKSFEESTDLMMHIHHNGSGVAGTYSYEVADLKKSDVIMASRSHNYPLRCEIKPA